MSNSIKCLLLQATLICGVCVLGKAQSFDPFPNISYQEAQLAITGFALASYLTTAFLIEDDKMDFYQAHAGFYLDGDSYTVIAQNFGVERRAATWFSLGIEANVQEMFGKGFTSMGFGLSAHFRWYLFGKKRVSPYFEYQNGAFYALHNFPEGGNNFTFRILYKVGLELTRSNRDKIRTDVGLLHQSNSDLFETNPAYNAFGLSLVYLWFWK